MGFSGSVLGMKNIYKVIVETSPKDPPKDFEMSAALIVAGYFKTDVIFQRQQILKSPDLIVRGQIWELKSPIGDGKNTIHNNIKNGHAQSYNTIIDLRRCKMNEQRAISRLRDAFLKHRGRKCRLLIINKHEKMLSKLK
ncbi:MAG: hypothetical protein IJF83_15560 [Methanobrevibacter sp.]|nr:hypothetical protein [Methanobrevibacter sp.]